jgi:hypothetical protein
VTHVALEAEAAAMRKILKFFVLVLIGSVLTPTLTFMRYVSRSTETSDQCTIDPVQRITVVYEWWPLPANHTKTEWLNLIAEWTVRNQFVVSHTHPPHVGAHTRARHMRTPTRVHVQIHRHTRQTCRYTHRERWGEREEKKRQMHTCTHTNTPRERDRKRARERDRHTRTHTHRERERARERAERGGRERQREAERET